MAQGRQIRARNGPRLLRACGDGQGGRTMLHPMSPAYHDSHLSQHLSEWRRLDGAPCKTMLSVTTGVEKSHVVQLCPPVTATIGDIMSSICELQGELSKTQRLFFGSRMLHCGETLLSLGLPVELDLVEIPEKRAYDQDAEEFYIETLNDDDKCVSIERLLHELGPCQWLFYCNDRNKALWLSEHLSKQGLSSAAPHGDMHPEETERFVQNFHSGGLRCLVLTNSAAPRLLQMEKPPVIVNFEVPESLDDYGHRVFRSGWYYGRSIVISFLAGTHSANTKYIREVEQYYHTAVRAWSHGAVPHSTELPDSNIPHK